MAQQVVVEPVEQPPIRGVVSPVDGTQGGTVSVVKDEVAKPVGEVPRQTAEPTGQDVVLKQDPVMPLPTPALQPRGDLQQAAGEDIAAQTAPTIQDILDQTTDDTEYMRILALQEKADAGDDDAYMALMSMTESQVPQGETVKAFVRDGQVAVPEELDPFEQTAAERIAAQQIFIDNLLRDSVPDPRVRQVFVEQGLGNFGEVLSERIAEMGRGTAILGATVTGLVPGAPASPLNTAAYYALAAMNDYMDGKFSSFGTAYASYAADIRRDSEANLDRLENIFGNQGITIGRAADAFVKDQLRQKVEDGLMTQEEYDEIVFQEVDGVRTEISLISDEAANSILQKSFNELPLLERFGVIAIENVVGMAGFGAGTAMKARKTVKQVRELKKQYPDLLGGLTDPELILETAHRAGVAKKLQKKWLLMGLKEERLDNSINGMADRISELGIKLSTLTSQGASVKGSVKYADYIATRNEYNLLQSTMVRATFTGKTIPIVRENVENALVISAGQLGARELLPQMTGLDEETSEFFGALGMSLGGYKLVKGVVEGGGARIVRMTDGMTNSRVTDGFGRAMDFFAWTFSGGTVGRGLLEDVPIPLTPFRFPDQKGKGVFTDETISLYEKSIGRPLSADERRGLSYATRLVQNMNPEQRDLVLKATEDYLALKNRIVSKFPPDLQKQADEMFTMSFAQSSALGPLHALNRLATRKIDVRNLKDFNADELATQMRMSQRQVEITERSLNNFQELLDSTTDMQGKEFVQEFIDNAKDGLKKHSADLEQDDIELLSFFDEMETVIFNDHTIDLPTSLFGEMIEGRRAIFERMGRSFDEKAEIIRLQEAFEEGIYNRMMIVRDMRGTDAHRFGVASGAEDIIDAHMEAIFARGELAYRNVEKFAEGRQLIDMAPLVENVLQKMEMTDIERFFSAGGDFFNGKLGKRALTVFERMVEREFPAEELAEMKALLGAEGEGLTNLEVALRMNKSSDTLNVFKQATPYEVDVMRRAFRDVGYRLTGQPEGRIYTEFAADLDKLIQTQDPEMFVELQKARKLYRDEVGDRLRPNQPLTKLEASRTGAEKVTRDVNDPFKYTYKNVDPVSLFDPITTAINKLVKGGRGQYGQKGLLKNKLMPALMRDFGERIDGGNVFDLTTEAGASKFRAIQAVLEEKVYEAWALETLESIKGRDIQAGTRITRRTLEQRTAGYDFTRQTDWQEVQSGLQVRVRVKDPKTGQIKIVEQPIVRMNNMISSENDIVKLIQDSEVVRGKYNDFARNMNTATSQLRKAADNEIKEAAQVFKELEPILGETNPKSFYEKFILNGSPATLESARSLSVDALMKAGRSRDEAEALFDKSAKSLISRAFLQRGGLQAVPGRFITSIEGNKTVARQFTTPEQLLMDVETNRSLLVSVMGEDHVNYLTDIADFLNMSADNAISNSQVFEGITRAMGTNEALSRVYNMARGMVSPLYVTSEFAVRLASQAGVEVLQLAGQDENAARIMLNMMRYPELVTKGDVEYMNEALLEFVATEFQRMGAQLPREILEEPTNEEEQ